ncbi:MAG: MBL fold metallo-hydrolase [Anaerolineae bacterium]
MHITCLVDNTVGGAHLWGEHGLAFLIEFDRRRVLWDTGASGVVLLHNMEALGIDPIQIEALALSHGHYDHTGGLADLLGRKPGLPLFAHPAFMEERVSRSDGQERAIGLPMSFADLAALVDLRLSAEPQEIIPGVWTTGQIRERPEREGRAAGHLARRDGALVEDPYEDDMGLVLERPEGLVLLLGCCHAGLLNTLYHVARRFGGLPTHVIGGTHLGSIDAAEIDHIVDTLKSMGTPWLYPNHCTGLSAYCRLAMGLGEQVKPCPAGTVLVL